jgi:hypothetical protein
MKKSQLKMMIITEVENMEKPQQREQLVNPEVKITDEIGKFFVVMTPDKNNTVDDIVSEETISSFASKAQEDKDCLSKTIGFFKQKSDARRRGTEALKEFESQLKELEDSMNEFRKHKSELDIKKSNAKEIIKKFKK